ncbi:MAG: phosphotransferase [Pseudomonadota bacterium]
MTAPGPAALTVLSVSGRPDVGADILSGTPWDGAVATPLAQDASVRRYVRLTKPDGSTAILATDPSPESCAAFAALSAHLRGLGLSAPKVLSVDNAAGMMLLEDLGDALYPKVIAAEPASEHSLYSCAIDAILTYSGATPPGLTPLDAKTMAAQNMIAFEWFADHPAPALQDRLEDVFAAHISPPHALMLRDVHADNLIWLPDRAGVARVGLLDFQDAMLCSRLYDIVSLIEDARRDLSPGLSDALYAKVADRLGLSLADVRTEAAALSLQRNLRILGVFARLCLRDGKASYLAFIPRVWGYIQRALDHLGNAGLTDAVRAALPEPSPDRLQALEAACSTIQKR